MDDDRAGDDRLTTDNLRKVRDQVMAEAAEAEQRQMREPWTERRVTALVARLGFLVCAIGTAISIGMLVALWAGFVAGTIAFGIIVLANLRSDQEARLNAETIAAHQSGPAAGRRFDVVPPMGRG